MMGDAFGAFSSVQTFKMKTTAILYFLCFFVCLTYCHAESNIIKIPFPTFGNETNSEETTQMYLNLRQEPVTEPLAEETTFSYECPEPEAPYHHHGADANATQKSDDLFFSTLTTMGTKMMIIYSVLFATLLLLCVCVIGLFCLFFMLANSKSGSYNFHV